MEIFSFLGLFGFTILPLSDKIDTSIINFKFMRKVALFFGGLGNEASVSVVSATNVAANFDQKRQRLVLVYWHRDGYFYKLEKMADAKKPSVKKRLAVSDFKKYFDSALLMTHGRYGEDGVLQGILESQKIPYSGCGVLSSALCMDKAVFKLLMSGQKIPQVPFFLLDYSRHSQKELSAIVANAQKKLRLPVYVKPANSGSSVGISKLDSWKQLVAALKEARRHDYKIILEQGLVKPREIEVAVLGNDKLTVSRPGELRLPQDFYDFEEKYQKGRTEVLIPAPLEKKQEKYIQELAAQAYRLADCRGFSRVDFFLSGKKLYLNEINTLPGFTDISMYPQLMMKMGMSYSGLINKLIDLAA